MLDTTFPNAATPTGSTAYYVTRFSAPEVQDNLAALFLWKEELSRLYSLTDPGVARIKLQWWQQQISLPQEAPSVHPLAAKLSLLFRATTAADSTFQVITSEIDRQLHRQPYVDARELWQGCLNHGGNLAKLIQVASHQPITTDTKVIGAWISFIEWLQMLGKTTRYGIKLLPVDSLQQHQLNYDQLLSSENQQQVQEIVFQLLEYMRSIAPPPEQKRAKTPLMKYYRLRSKLLELLIQEDFSIMHQRISLTPIRKLWFAL